MNPFIQRRYVFRQMYARCVLSNNALLRPTMEQPISPFRSDLPPNLTILGLENAASRRARGSDFKRNDLSKPRLKSAGQKTQITRLEKKIKFFSGIPVNNVDRLNKHGKPLIKNVLSSCVAAGNYGAAVVACEEKLQSGESIDGRMLTTMIRTFGSAGDPDKAIALLSRIGKDQVIRAKLDNFHCAAVIHACGVNRQWWKALTVLDMCKKDPNLKLNAFVYGAAMTACMHGKRFDKAMNLFEDFLATRIKSDISIYNIALSAAGKGGHHDKVIAIFSQLLREGAVRPDAITYMAVLNSCAISGDYVKALDIFDQIKDIPWLRPNLKMRTALVTACLKAGRPIEALKIVREVCQDSSISVRSANAEASGDISSEFLHWKFPGTRHSGANKMGIGEAPDSLLIGLGIVACSMLPALSGLAVQLLEQIISNKMEPTYSSISNVIMCLEADGKVEEAIRVYRMCHEMGFLKHQATDVDLPCPLGMESTENISNERIVLNLVGLYGEHMVTTRLRCFFRFVLHKYASRDAKSTSGPGALMIIGRDTLNRQIVSRFFENELLLGDSPILMPVWNEKRNAFAVTGKQLDFWMLKVLKSRKNNIKINF